MRSVDGSVRAESLDGTNDLVPLVLGLLKALDDLASRVEQPAAAVAPAGGDAALVDALLGLLALRRTVRAWVGAAAAQGRAEPRAAKAEDPVADYLR